MIAPASAALRTSPPLTPLEVRLRSLFPPLVTVAVSDPARDHACAFPQEAAIVARATPARRREFLAGRAALHAAMGQLGLPARAVECGPDRAPVWPDDLVGSLSHNATICIAAMARSRDLRSLGVDVEDHAPLDPGLIPEICTLAERAWLAIQPEAERGILARLIFSAKECAYKCQYPVSGALFGFDALEITPDPDTGQFEATFLGDVPGFVAGACLHGRFVMTGGLIVTAIALAHGPRWLLQGQ